MRAAVRHVIPLTILLVARSVGAEESALVAQARDLVGTDQGVYVEAEDGTVLVAQAADRAVHPASVTKVFTTLALLRGLGPEHRFTTRVGRTGAVASGRIVGDLVIDADGDPFLVYENVFRMLEQLDRHGIDRVGGRLRIQGPLLFNWKPDPSGERLAQAFSGREGRDAWAAAVTTPGLTLERAALTIESGTVAGDRAPEPLLIHESARLIHIMKALNGYSNNVFHFLSDRIGGPKAVERVAQSLVPADWRDEILIDNGAGGGATNRVSPRATVAVIRALERDLAKDGRTLTDVLPVAGRDAGTLRERLGDRADRGAIVGKTGTYGDVGACALAGVIQTRRWGRLAFAILNRNVPVPDARKRQDAFVRALLDAGEGVPWRYETIPVPTIGDARVRPAG